MNISIDAGRMVAGGSKNGNRTGAGSVGDDLLDSLGLSEYYSSVISPSTGANSSDGQSSAGQDGTSGSTTSSDATPAPVIEYVKKYFLNGQMQLTGFGDTDSFTSGHQNGFRAAVAAATGLQKKTITVDGVVHVDRRLLHSTALHSTALHSTAPGGQGQKTDGQTKDGPRNSLWESGGGAGGLGGGRRGRVLNVRARREEARRRLSREGERRRLSHVLGINYRIKDMTELESGTAKETLKTIAMDTSEFAESLKTAFADAGAPAPTDMLMSVDVPTESFIRVAITLAPTPAPTAPTPAPPPPPGPMDWCSSWACRGGGGGAIVLFGLLLAFDYRRKQKRKDAKAEFELRMEKEGVDVKGLRTDRLTVAMKREKVRIDQVCTALIMLYSLILYCTHTVLILHSLILHSLILHSLTLHSLILHSLSLHSLTLHSLTLHSLTLHSLILHSLTLHSLHKSIRSSSLCGSWRRERSYRY
jgi:hypothetical protein